MIFKHFLKHLPYLGLALFAPLLVLAVQITVPSSPAQGYTLNGLSTGNWQATSSLFISSLGKVGIGTTSPYSLLSISNNVGTAQNTPLFTIASTTAGTSTSTLLTVLANGNIGIGTSTPIQKLSIFASSTDSAIEFESAYIGSSFVCGNNVTGLDNLQYGTVLGEDGKCWFNKNLGATQVATAYADANSYGSLYQWGRAFDGHQATTSLIVGTTTLGILDKYLPASCTATNSCTSEIGRAHV